MNKIIYFVAALLMFNIIAACDEDDASLYYEKQTFSVGNVTWASGISASDKEVISDLLDHMVKVEACQFWMGAQSKSTRRANYFVGFNGSPDTLWTTDSVYLLPDTVTRYHTVDTIIGGQLTTKKVKYRSAFCAVYKYYGVPVGPVLEVSMPDYYIGQYEITQRQWMAVMDGKYPEGNYCKFPNVKRDSAWYVCTGKGDDIPAYNVSYDDAVEFCQRLSQKTGLQFRLPTEAEWECAARGGKYSRGYKYAGTDAFSDAGWIYTNACSQNREDSLRFGPRPVGEKLANELGIYDMSGNVSEWVANSFYRYSRQDSINPQGPAVLGDTLILRGGSWTMKNSADFGLATRKKFIQSSYSKESNKTGSFYDAISYCGLRVVVSAK